MLRLTVVRLVPAGLSGQQARPAASAAFWARGLADQRHGPAKPGFPLCIPKAETTAKAVANQGPRPTRRFIACPELARTVVSRLGAELQKTVVLECEPGPGILTRTLLNAGAQVITLESNKSFLCDLEMLEEKLNGQLKAVHCDFFKLDPIGLGLLMPPVMYSENLFDKLGILDVAWTADVPVKVIGIVPQEKERNLLWKFIYALYERSSIYKYGRIELNLFLSEKEYKTLIANPSERRIYQALSILWQTACDIQLVHMEPWSSFLTNSKRPNPPVPKKALLQNDHLCLVRLTPRKDLFSDSLTTANSKLFVLMVKQCLIKSKTQLVDKLNLWTCENVKQLLGQLEIPENSTTGSLYPEQYKCLFHLMQQSNRFDQSWVYDNDFLEYHMDFLNEAYC
nr:dimethyladenosine transferase 2, mitochondrial [Pogona vitticeps]